MNKAYCIINDKKIQESSRGFHRKTRLLSRPAAPAETAYSPFGNKKCSPYEKMVCIWSAFSGDVPLFFVPKPPLTVLAARRVPAADMPLAQIDAEHLAHPAAQRGIDAEQPLGDVLMYGGLAHAEFRGAGAHRTTRFQNVFRIAAGAPLHILPHSLYPP